MAATGIRVGELPSYYQCFLDNYRSLLKYCENSTEEYNYPWDFFSDLQKYGSISSQDIWLVVALGVLWTLVRSGLTVAVFQPLAAAMKGMKSASREKFPESVFKFLYYTSTWSYCAYLLLYSQRHPLFVNPYRVWEDWQPLMPVETDIYVLYLIQCSFYLHSIYATIFMDVWRKDSGVMLFHHFLTLALIGFSFAIRYHKIGVLVLFVHDITDVALEGTKLNVYMKDCGGKYRYALHDALATVGFISFATFWFVFRLYWFPLKVLHASGHGGIVLTEELPPLWLFFNVMLWLLQILNVYWFMFIVQLLYKIATGQLKELADVREDEDEDGEAAAVAAAENGKKNGGKNVAHQNGHGGGGGLAMNGVNGDTVIVGNGANGTVLCNGTGEHYDRKADDVTDDVINAAEAPRARQRKRPAGGDE